MKNISLNTEYFKINEENSNKIYYGCSQEWYRNFWQRRAGCGPTTATNLIIYLMNSNKLNESNKSKYKYDKYNCILQMEEMWKYVTPTLKGVNTTKILYEGLYSFARDNKLAAEYKYIDIPSEKNIRPTLTEVLNFISVSLEKNAPVAFLNLSNGDEKHLDNWHWVTIISLEFENENENENRAVVEIVDEGRIKKIDFTLWYNTTILGGGLVSFIIK